MSAGYGYFDAGLTSLHLVEGVPLAITEAVNIWEENYPPVDVHDRSAVIDRGNTNKGFARDTSKDGQGF